MFDEHFPPRCASTVERWTPTWSKQTDPSGRFVHFSSTYLDKKQMLIPITEPSRPTWPSMKKLSKWNRQKCLCICPNSLYYYFWCWLEEHLKRKCSVVYIKVKLQAQTKVSNPLKWNSFSRLLYDTMPEVRIWFGIGK